MPVVAVRHAAVVAAAAGRWHGAGSDPEADPAALRRLGPVLRALARRHPPDLVLSSPARRARRTAALLGRPIRLDVRLAERHFGAWEGLPVGECLAGVGPEWLTPERWPALPIPGAEPPAAVEERTAALWRELAPGPGWAWCVGHGGSVRGLLAAATGLPLAATLARPLAPGEALVLAGLGGGSGRS